MAFIPIQTYVIPVTGSASTALAIAESLIAAVNETQAMIYAAGCDIVYKFGDDNTVAASPTVTSNKLVAKNTPVPQGAIIMMGDIKHWVSAVSLDGTSTGTLYITTGYNEKV